MDRDLHEAPMSAKVRFPGYSHSVAQAPEARQARTAS